MRNEERNMETIYVDKKSADIERLSSQLISDDPRVIVEEGGVKKVACLKGIRRWDKEGVLFYITVNTYETDYADKVEFTRDIIVGDAGVSRRLWNEFYAEFGYYDRIK